MSLSVIADWHSAFPQRASVPPCAGFSRHRLNVRCPLAKSTSYEPFHPEALVKFAEPIAILLRGLVRAMPDSRAHEFRCLVLPEFSSTVRTILRCRQGAAPCGRHR